MNQLYEKKCDCKNQYDDSYDHRLDLIKMELPEYDDSQYGGRNYTIFRAIRFICYVVVLVLLGYSLWRIHVLEENLHLCIENKLVNVSRIIALESNTLQHHRIRRSIKSSNLAELNSVNGVGEKNMARGSMLTAKNENVPAKGERLSKEQFNYLVNSLFDTIQTMHNDTNREHVNKNMKAVFQAWFPVFDALLPKDMVENTESIKELRKIRSVDKSSEESSEERKTRVARSVDKSTEESSEEKKQRVVRAVDKSSEESSEEKKQEEQGNKIADQKPSSEGKITVNQDNQKSSEESSEEVPKKQKRSIDQSNEDSSSSSDSSESTEKKKSIKRIYDLDNTIDCTRCIPILLEKERLKNHAYRTSYFK